MKNDFKKSKLITVMTMLFVAIATFLFALAAILMVNLSGAIDTLMVQAKAPHFLQMHQGDINDERIAAFASQSDLVESYQIVEFLNVEGSKIQLGEENLSESVQDNGLCVQNASFDYLLDLDNKIIEPKIGEVYVPINYMKEGKVEVGDEAIILGEKFVIAGFLRDSQMNSELALSKRFLVHPSEFEKLKELGRMEYIIEFRVKDLSSLGTLETAYSQAGLETNGPTVTYPNIRMINALSDGIMIALIMIMSLLIVAIALMCIRFTLLAKIEEEYREIGAMKAIGIRVSDIKKLYLVKYAGLTISGCVLGLILASIGKNQLLKIITLYFGECANIYIAYIAGVLGAAIIFGIIMLYINGVLKQFKTLSAVQALRYGQTEGKKKRKKNKRRWHLHNQKQLSTNVFLGMQDVWLRKRLYMTMFIVLTLSLFISIVPRNLYYTIASEDFIGYMGVGKCNLRIDIQQGSDSEAKATQIMKILQQDSEIDKQVVLTTKSFETLLEDGTKERLKVELGDHTIFPVNYMEGSMPKGANEIALSYTNAKELGKKVGDTLPIIINQQRQDFKVCGIYPDVTNGGKTSKACFNAPEAETMWSVICMTFTNPKLTSVKEKTIQSTFDFAKVSNIKEYANKIFGSTINALLTASNIAMVVSVIITLLITALFIKMLIAKDRQAVALLKTLGFYTKDLKIQYITRSVVVVGLASIVGIVLASTLGEVVGGMLISSFGGAAFKLMAWPVMTYFICPLLLIGSVIIATWIATTELKEIKISESIKE